VIGAEQEHARTGEGTDFFDAVSLDFADGERDVFGLVRVIRRPNAGRTSAVVVIFGRSEVAVRDTLEREGAVESWERAQIERLTIETNAPLERSSATFSAGDMELKLAANAVSTAAGFGGQMRGLHARPSGVEGYEQVCEVEGHARLAGKSYELRCYGLRRHSWGRHDWSRFESFRSLHAITDQGGAVSVVSARPAGASGHGDDPRTAMLIAGRIPTIEFEDVRLSTVYGDDALPVKAGLELYEEGSDFPRRISGTRAYGTSVSLGGETVSVTFMRWVMEARGALGSYEIVARS
jgi:hypothetical protein